MPPVIVRNSGLFTGLSNTVSAAAEKFRADYLQYGWEAGIRKATSRRGLSLLAMSYKCLGLNSLH